MAKTRAIVLGFLPKCRLIYPKTHIIPALTTGAPNPTKITKKLIPTIIKRSLRKWGALETKKLKNTISILILKPLTAIRCVSQELLKFSSSSFGISSLAQKRIPARNIRSSDGYSFVSISIAFCLHDSI